MSNELKRSEKIFTAKDTKGAKYIVGISFDNKERFHLGIPMNRDAKNAHNGMTKIGDDKDRE